jgi:hypothetical protein
MGILVKIKANRGDRVIVYNYRRNDKAEYATVQNVTVGINKDGGYHVSYYVRLDRVTTGRSRMYPEGGKPLFLTVGDEKIVRVD